MPQIGTFERTSTGFAGHIRTVMLDLELVIVVADPVETENAPDFRVHRGKADGPEIGAAWKRQGEKAGEYLSLSIDDPTFASPLRANLFRSGESSTWHLQWNRSPQRPDQRD
jgi:uncharacterized protein (DUF736 family)